MEFNLNDAKLTCEYINPVEQDFYRHLDYIHYNPIKHNLVKSSKDYKYTTFEKFVKLGLYEENWCNFENKNKIADLDFE